MNAATPVMDKTFTPLNRHSEILNDKDLKMIGPWPADGRVVKGYGYEGSPHDSRSGFRKSPVVPFS